MSRHDQRLSGLYSLAYLGTDAVQPTNIILNDRDPSSSDRRNVYIGSWWLNTVTNDLFYLASLADGMALWINISSGVGTVQTLTGNSGGPVSPTANNINLVGDGPTIKTAKTDPHTITATAGGTGLLATLTGNTGGPVRATATTINVIGTGSISVAGNPGISTLTISNTPASPESFDTQSGTATPAAGILKVFGSNNITTSGSGNTVTVTAGPSIAQSYITSPATGTAVPAAGVLTFVSGTDTTISAAGSTITINGTSGGGSVPSYSTGTFTPGLAYTGTTTSITITSALGNYTQIGAAVYITARIAFSSNGTGLLTMTNLPFTVSNATSNYVISSSAFYNSYTAPAPRYFWLRFIGGTTTAAFYVEFTNEAATPLLLVFPSISITLSGWYYI